MNYEEFRNEMDAWWATTDTREMARKNSQGVLVELMELYEGLVAADRILADQVLVDWLTATNDRKRFDALAMVDHFGIRMAVAKLRSLATEAKARDDHEAPFDLAMIERILERLEGNGTDIGKVVWELRGRGKFLVSFLFMYFITAGTV